VKSLQLILNEWGERLERGVSASALSQARLKLSHTAFIELLEKAVIEVIYGDGDYERFRGHRLLALDGSSLRLPNTAETRERFGYVTHLNGNSESCGGQVEAKMSVLYDVLNEIPLLGKLDQGRANDLSSSREHLELLGENDLLLADRGYTSYRFFSDIRARNAHFVVRCKSNSFRKQHKLAADDAHGDTTVKLPKPRGESSQTPDSLTVRFVQLQLPDGQIEVLATSLVNKKKYPRKIFRKLYYKRWRIETYYQTLKSRLCIDNFSGKSVEAILQDFYSTLFVSGLETLLTGEANEILSEKSLKHPQKVNKAISFHVIKNSVMRLIFENPPDLQEQITKLFQQNPTAVRPQARQASTAKCKDRWK
jgi:hypothetical protein